MGSDETATTWGDPYALVREVTSYRDTTPSFTAAGDEVDDPIHQAHRLISADLYVIERLKQSSVEPDYAGLFGEQLQEKIAALIYLAKQKLLDIEQSTLESRDVNDAKRDLTNYVEIIFHLKAVDALMMFYDFADAQSESRVPRLWRNVCSRCLYLMSLLTECRDKVVNFFKDRPEASELMQELQQTTKPEIAQALQGLARDYNTSTAIPAGAPDGATAEAHTGARMMGASAPMAAPLYIALVQQYEERFPTTAGRSAATRGVSSLLSAQDRIKQAAATGDTSSLLDWISNGSPAAMNTAFRSAISVMSTNQYIVLMEQSIRSGNLDPVRLTAVALELSALGRSTNPQGGEPTVNRLLLQLALTTDPAFSGVAKVAVHELAAVSAFNQILSVLEKAPLLDVAEESVRVIADMRKLVMVESLLAKRPQLTPIYRQARKAQLDVQELVDSVWSCQSKDLALIYLNQLKRANAYPELKNIAMGQNFIAGLAQDLLADYQGDAPWVERGEGAH